MAFIRMDIQSIVVGGGPVTSLIILRPRHNGESSTSQLPIRIGTVEATAIGMGVNPQQHERPMTHDLLFNTIEQLGATINDVVITHVNGTTFYARVRLMNTNGEPVSIDARPSDAIALAVRARVPILADEQVLTTASLPDFNAVERKERAREEEAFHEFVESLSPEDFDV